MEEYRAMVTPLQNKCEVREVSPKSPSGRRWHVRAGGRSFYLSGDRYLPPDATEEQLIRGVLRAVDLEFVSPREMMAPDYEVPLGPADFE